MKALCLGTSDAIHGHLSCCLLLLARLIPSGINIINYDLISCGLKCHLFILTIDGTESFLESLFFCSYLLFF